MKIYTKTGDTGETSLFGGQRVPKSHLRIDAYGGIDEINSMLGLILSKTDDRRASQFLEEVQKDLFAIGGRLAGASLETTILRKRVTQMEKIIDELSNKLPELRNFILPGGGKAGALLHLGRSIVRRVERNVVLLSTKEQVDLEILVYLNRLSDLLFVLARYINFKDGKPDIVWKLKT